MEGALIAALSYFTINYEPEEVVTLTMDQIEVKQYFGGLEPVRKLGLFAVWSVALNSAERWEIRRQPGLGIYRAAT